MRWKSLLLLHHHHHHHHHHSPNSPHLALLTLTPFSSLPCTNPHQQPPPSHPTPPQTLSHPSAADLVVGLSEKPCSPDNALQLHDKITQPNLLSWNRLISSYNRTSQFDCTLRTFINVTSSGLEPDQFTYSSALSACTLSRNVQFGEQLFSLVLRNGLVANGYVLAGLIDLFAKSGSFECALRVFLDVSTDNVVCWNQIITAGFRNGENLIALVLFREMVAGFCVPNAFTFSSVLSACAALGDWYVGRGIHAWVVKCNAEEDVFVGSAIIDLYAKCGDMDAVMREFMLMPVRNVVSWTSVISGFVQKDDAVDALQFFKEMVGAKVEINSYTITSVLAACAKSLMERVAIQVHCWTLKTMLYLDSVVKNALISTYAKIGSIQMAEKVFREAGLIMESPSTWSAMISALAQSHSSRRSIELLRRMFREGLKPDRFCCSSVLSIVECIGLGTVIHSYVVKTGLVVDVLVACALFTMYSKCGSIEDSYELFRQMPERDRVAWSSMIAGFAEHGRAEEAFQLFRELMHEQIKPDEMTLSAVLRPCDAQQFLTKGKEIHGHAFRVGLGHDTLIGGSLVTMYSKCKCILLAKRVFDGVPLKDHAVWSSLVSGYATNGYSKEVTTVFHQMMIAGFEIDHFTCSSVLGMCAALSSQALGRLLHAYVTKAGLNYCLSVSSALVTMYSKCGSIDDSRKVFDEIGNPGLITWTAIINGYAQHGRGLEALNMFEVMKEHGFKPDSMTMVGVLTACSHNGFVEEGFLYFNSMNRDFGIEPSMRHYACMVDLLGRAGRLKEAVTFIDLMPIEPDSLVWSTLLGACRVHGHVDLGRFAAKMVVEVESHDSGPYISLSNITADIGDWEEVVRIRGSMNQVATRKEPGWSII